MLEKLSRFEIKVSPSDQGDFVAYADYEALLGEFNNLQALFDQTESINHLSEEHHYQDALTDAMKEVVTLEKKVHVLTVSLLHIAQDCDPAEAIEFAKNTLTHLAHLDTAVEPQTVK